MASEKILQNKFCTAKQIEPCDRISIGCRNLDHLLNGGFPVNGINELYGCSGVGKTQICLQLALQIQLPEDSGGKGQGSLNKVCVAINNPRHCRSGLHMH